MKKKLTSYDFTASASRAFGNNMIQVSISPVLFGIISGDTDKNNIIDLFDIILTYNSANTFESGYINSDINGNGEADLQDIITVYNNSEGFLSVIKL